MLLRELFEERSKSIGIIFGRFNPPHQGHVAAWQIASENDVWVVGTNKDTQGPKDPLPFEIKIQAMKTLWPEIQGHVVAEQGWLTLASKMFAKYKNATLNVYTDEDWVIKTLIQYNGKENTHGFYNFSNIEQKATPRLSSATALRDAVIKGDREAFSKAAGVDANTDVAGTPYFDLVAHYLLPYQNAPKKSAAKKKVKEPAKQDVEEEAAGVGIITKQNSTADVDKNTPRKNLKAFKLI
jgi:nicotinamide mononucleotide adenylyltransferase